MARTSLVRLGLCLLVVGALSGWGPKRPAETPQQRYDAAKALFERAGRDYHIPSAQARGAEQRRLQDEAAAIYQRLSHDYADQPLWAAQAVRSLANIRAAQTNISQAVHLYAQVGERFATLDFEVLMAWKSAGDLLSDTGREGEARRFYEKIVARFDKPDALPIVKSVVRGAKNRMQSPSQPAPALEVTRA